MKKLISMLSVLVLAIGTMMVTGCGLKDLAAPKDEWCSYTAEMDSVKLDAYFYYATADKSVTIDDNRTINLVKGLNVVIADVDSAENSVIAEGVTSGKKAYYFQSFAEGQKMSVEGDDGSDKSFSVSSTAWLLIYAANYGGWDTYSNKTLPIVHNSTSYESVEDLKDSFDLKKVLKKIALSKLIEILDSDSAE